MVSGSRAQDKDVKEIRARAKEVWQPRWLINYLSVIFSIPHDALVLLGLEKAAVSSKRTPTERKMTLCKLDMLSTQRDVWIIWSGYSEERGHQWIIPHRLSKILTNVQMNVCVFRVWVSFDSGLRVSYWVFWDLFCRSLDVLMYCIRTKVKGKETHQRKQEVTSITYCPYLISTCTAYANIRSDQKVTHFCFSSPGLTFSTKAECKSCNSM